RNTVRIVIRDADEGATQLETTKTNPTKFASSLLSVATLRVSNCSESKMVQGLLLNALTTSRNGAFCGSMPSWRKHFKLMTKTQISSVIERHGIWHLCHQSLVLRGNPNMLKQRNVRVEAGWLFRRGDQGLNASSEQSEAANEDILIFFFQLDLATRVQYALNTEQYDIAQQLRNKLTEVEAEVIRQQEAKRGSSLKSEAQDKAISIIRLRADLQKAIESENYVLAAKLRDAISELEAESLAASAKALAHENANYSFRLGQRVRHKNLAIEQWFVEWIPYVVNQVLVDVHADPNLLVAYVSEENLLAPDEPDVDRFDHPYISFLFYGMDAAGDFIRSSNCERSTIDPDMKYPLIH
ncbi:uvrB/uvrC motif-containing protein, partial [Prunus dulcis]